MDTLEQLFSASDDISGLTLAEIQSKLLAETTIPEGYCTTLMYNKLFIYLLNVTDDVPRIAASITVDNDLTTYCSQRRPESRALY